MNSNHIFSQLTPNTIVLTPNKRLCAFLREQFDVWQLQHQKDTWPSLKALPMMEWFQQLWLKNFQNKQIILDNEQLEYIWRSIILNHSNTLELLKLDATVKQAIEALRVLVLWQVPFTANEFSTEVDWKQFYHWVQTYLNYCETKNYIDIYHIPIKLLTSIEQHQLKISLPEKILLLGFDELPPAWQQLLDTLKPFIDIQKVDFVVPSLHQQRIEFSSFNHELAKMIDWVHQQYLATPTQTIGCIIPSLANKRTTIEKAFIKTFAPEVFLGLNEKDAMPFNISAGQPLSKFEIINSALKLITLDSKLLPISIIKFLLRNSFIVGYYKEYAQRAALEIIILNLQNYHLHTDHFLQLLQHHCPILALHFQKFISISNPENDSILTWINFFNQKLEALGWPGERELSSQNYQLVFRFKNLLTELLSIGQLFNQCSYQQAKELLLKRANDTIFQIKTSKKNIQILGSLEAAGMIFDKLWIMEMNDKQWPAAANPNPFIPHRIQRTYQLPHANAERELNFSKLLLNRFFNSATEIYLSYAKEDGQQEYNCSTLINDIPLTNNETIPIELIDQIRKGNELEYLEEPPVPFSTTELATIKGGTSILAAQAACPFRAFALHRLEVKVPLIPQPGLTALERGAIIHATLEIFWRQVKTRTDFCKLTEEAKAEIIDAAARAAIFSINAPLYQSSPKLYKLEFKRVTKLIMKWLELEKQRADFYVIATEQELKIEFAGLPLKIRIDRIDKLATGALVLIDYKTNITSINRWFGERLDEPQLPLYALIYPDKVAGIIFGQIKANEFSIKGIGNLETIDLGITNITDVNVTTCSTWDEQKQQWEKDLLKLTKDFLAGIAIVDPKNGKQTCTFCELESLCRIGDQNEDNK